MVTTATVKTPEVYLEAMNTIMSSESEFLASLYYPLYGGIASDNDEEEEEDISSSVENGFVVYTSAIYGLSTLLGSIAGR